jgi:AraC-like DNA-binding protein
MAQLTRFSTNPLPREQQFPLWLDRLRHYFGDVNATRTRHTPGFEAHLESIAERGVVVTRMRTGPQYIEHIESPARAEHKGYVHLVFPVSGRFEVEQAGRCSAFEPGDWGIFDLSATFRSMVERPLELLVLAAPREMILSRQVDLAGCAARRFASRGGARVVRNFLASLIEEQSTLTPGLRRDYTALALQLARSNIMEVAVRASRKSCDKRAEIESYIANHLRDPDLSVETVAARCGCSKRYIHKIFAAAGETAGQHILRARLAGSAEDLASSELRHLSITDVAVSWGFNSSSAFSRVFRKQFKVSPSQYRRSPQSPGG